MRPGYVLNPFSAAELPGWWHGRARRNCRARLVFPLFTTSSSLGTREWTECRHWFLHSTRPLHENRTKIPQSLPSPTPRTPTSSGLWRLTAEAGSVAVCGLGRSGSRARYRAARSAPRSVPGAWRPLRTRGRRRARVLPSALEALGSRSRKRARKGKGVIGFIFVNQSRTTHT